MKQQLSYLVTGGYGFIGSLLVNALKGKVTILSRSEKHKERVIRKDLKVILKDLNEIEKKDVEGVDIIYHCASTVDNYNVLSNPYIDVQTNIIGTIKLLEICKDLPKRPKIIFPSTFFVYGNEYDRTKKPINEESRTDPLALYPATKLCTESIIKLYSKLYQIPYIICRLTNVYGEEEEYNNKKKGALNYLIMQLVKGNPTAIYKGGNFYRDYIYVGDVVSAFQFLESRVKNDTFLIGYGKSTLFKDIIEYTQTLTEKRSSITEIEPPPFHKIVGITNFVADTSKIRNLGWKPKIDYKGGIRRVVNKYKSLHL